MKITANIQGVSHTSDTPYKLDPNYEHSFALSGTGTWQVWDGAAWLDYSESSGTTQAFRALPPPSGLVNLNVTTPPGPVVASFHRILPEGRTRKGN